MFLTQTQFQGFYTSKGSETPNRMEKRSKSLFRKKFEKLSSVNTQAQANGSRKSSSTRTFNATDFNKQARYTSLQKKWNKIVDLYNIPSQNADEQVRCRPIRPGAAIYHLLANPELLKKHKLKINFPETFIQISGELFQIKTNSTTKQLECRKIQRQMYFGLMSSYIQNEMAKIRVQQNLKQKQQYGLTSLKDKYKYKYKKHYDYKMNGYAPVVVAKIGDQFDLTFQVDVESYKNFAQKRSKPSSNKIIQRFIYSRNMKAMILRICYHRRHLGQQHEQFFAYRFQNIDNIFRINKKNNQIYQTFKAQSTINASYQREDKIQYCKILNMKGLQKYIGPSKQLISFLQQSQKIKINQLYIDYVVDLFNEPWLINIKKIEYQNSKIFGEIKVNNHHGSLHVAGSYGICRLCSIEYLKKYLRKSISNKMLCQFLAHLKKRMKIQQYQNIQFVKDIIKKNTKNYITLQVCQGCYRIVAEQYKLIESQHKLAKMCNIEPRLQLTQPRAKPLNLSNNLKQWRLMIYFVGVSNLPQKLIREQDQILLKYKLGVGDSIQQTWRIKAVCKSNSSGFHTNANVGLNMKKIKIHYFYSQTSDIDTFLKQTELNLQLAYANDQKVFAKGSSGTLSSFGRQFDPDLCLRQTSIVLLFYSDGQYCQMTIKVGLICDGMYQLSESVQLIPLNKVYFADNNFTNSNPIPKEWMEAFGVNHEIYIPQVNYQQIMSPELTDNFLQFYEPQKDTTKKGRNNIARKSLHLLR